MFYRTKKYKLGLGCSAGSRAPGLSSQVNILFSSSSAGSRVEAELNVVEVYSSPSCSAGSWAYKWGLEHRDQDQVDMGSAGSRVMQLEPLAQAEKQMALQVAGSVNLLMQVKESLGTA